MEQKTDSLTAVDELIGKQDLTTQKKALVAHINAQRDRLQPESAATAAEAEQPVDANIPIVTDSVEAGLDDAVNLAASEDRVSHQRTNPQFDDSGNLIPPDVANASSRTRSNAYPRSATMKILTNKKVLISLAVVIGLSVGNKVRKKVHLPAKVKQVIVPVNLNDLKKVLATDNGRKNICFTLNRLISLAPMALKSWGICRSLIKANRRINED